MQFVLVTRVSTELDKNIHFKFFFCLVVSFPESNISFVSADLILFDLVLRYPIYWWCSWQLLMIWEVHMSNVDYLFTCYCVVSLSLIFFCISFYSTCLIDIVLYLCEKEHVEGGMIFQLLEDLTEMSTMRNCEDVFGYIESKQDILGKVCFIFFMLHCFTLGIVESLYVFNFSGYHYC